MAVYNIVAGTTDALVFQLLENGTPIDISSYTVTLLLEDRTGTTISSPGTVTQVDGGTTGKVSLAPTDANVFVAANGPYYARWKLVDVFTKVGFVPSSERDTWRLLGSRVNG